MPPYGRPFEGNSDLGGKPYLIVKPYKVKILSRTMTTRKLFLRLWQCRYRSCGI